MLYHVIWQILTDVLDEITASTTALMMETVSSSETLVNFYQTTWCNIPEDSHLHCISKKIGTQTSLSYITCI
jgi:hypothetical protein